MMNQLRGNKSYLDLEFKLAEAGVIRTLLYFDIFHYPLTLEEIIRFHPHQDSRKDIEDALSDLLNKSIVYQHENFYSLHAIESIVQRRKTGNALAKKKLQTARRFSELISKFPFVRALMLSGSLSKDYMEETSDIDYFIITTPGRLWLVRGLLALFKRIFLLNSHKFFCTNYLIDLESLEIEEKNIYTAMETTTLVPVYGKALCQKFMDRNQWTREHFPNMNVQRTAFIEEKPSYIKRFLESVFNGNLGERLDLFFMKLAIKRLNKKFGNQFTRDEFELAFKSRRSVSKNHPRFFQKQILSDYQKKIEAFELVTRIKLSA